MKFLIAPVMALASLSLAHAANDMPAGVIAEGQKASAPCAACHNADGNSAVPTFPRLAGQHPRYIYKQLMDFKSGKRYNAIMAQQVANLTPQQMANLAVYFASKKSAVSPGDESYLAFGQKLYLGGKSSAGVIPCAGCHGPNGRGNPYAVFPKIGGQHPEYIKAQLQAFRAAGRGDLGSVTRRNNDGAKPSEPGMMQTVAARLSDQDIEYLANFLGGLH
jgi:cytochrome c553